MVLVVTMLLVAIHNISGLMKRPRLGSCRIHYLRAGLRLDNHLWLLAYCFFLANVTIALPISEAVHSVYVFLPFFSHWPFHLYRSFNIIEILHTSCIFFPFILLYLHSSFYTSIHQMFFINANIHNTSCKGYNGSKMWTLFLDTSKKKSWLRALSLHI